MILDLTALKREIRQKSTSVARLLEIAALGSRLSRWIAVEKNTPPEVLAYLACSNDWVTRARVAGHKKAYPATLENLAAESEDTVIRNLLLNPQLPAEILQRLTQHKQASVRDLAFHVALSRNVLPESEVKQRVKDLSWEIRATIAGTWKSLDMNTALTYLKDPDPRVRRLILFRQQKTHPIRKRKRRHSLALTQPISIEHILPLMNDSDDEVRSLVYEVLKQMNLNSLEKNLHKAGLGSN